MSYKNQQPETLAVRIDYEELLSEALRKVNTAFDSPEFAMQEHHNKFSGSTTSASHIGLDRYENYVLNVLAHISPKWIDKDNAQFPERYSKWVTTILEYRIIEQKWRAAHAAWENSGKDPMEEPIQPPDPTLNAFGELAPPKPFSVEVRDCKIDGTWKPFNLYHVILKFLHRQGFFKRFELEIIESEQKEAEDQENSGLQEEDRPVGGPSGPTEDTVTRKQSLQS